MKKYEFGEIVLLSFPMANYFDIKKRPALVILDTGDEDFLAARITTLISRGKYDYEIAKWRESGLLRPSVIRLDKIATLEKSLVLKKLGALDKTENIEAKKIIRMICESI